MIAAPCLKTRRSHRVRQRVFTLAGTGAEVRTLD